MSTILGRSPRYLTVFTAVTLFITGALGVGRVSAQTGCPGTPIYDTSPNPLTGIINSYYPGLQNEAAGSTVIEVGPRTGSSTLMAVGDMALVIQMQDAAFDRNNDQGYGDNVNGDPDSGVTALNSTGLYEFVRITAVTGNPPTSFTIQSTGTGGGLANAYHAAAPDLTGGTQNGQKTFQVIRCPQYLDATVAAGLTAKAWGGAVQSTTAGPTGGVLVFDVANVLTLNSQTIDVSGLGFRGGGGRALGGGAGASTDRVTLSTNAANGSKAEGIGGTPRYVYESASNTVVDNTSEGYPAGSYGLGAPGNAGGGGTDGTPTDNADNSGGGGGGNCGAGGKGGNAYANQATSGGWGGAAVSGSSTRVVMGGGGGAGSTNNGSADDGVDHIPADGTGLPSSGGAGGGIVIIRAWKLSGTGTITTNGAAGPVDAGRDGGGGGGAGGSVVLATIAGPVNSVTVNANGANGRNAWPSRSPAGNPGERHGPGGGGAGGAVYSTGPLAASSVTGGTRGITTTANDVYGSTNGSSGCVSTLPFPTGLPGVTSGGECRGVTSVDLVSFDATSYDNGVLLRWRTGLERDNLGFNLYRDDDGKRVRVTPDIVAGSTLGFGDRIGSGCSYAWWDPNGTASSRYLIEDIDFAGRGVLSGPASVAVAAGAAPVGSTVRSALLGEATPTVSGVTDPTQTVWNVGDRVPVSVGGRTGAASAKGGASGGDSAPTQWQIAAQSAVKITVQQPGFYRVTQPELAALGFDPSRIDPRTFRLFVDGAEIAMRVAGEEDGRFDPSDAIEFFGSGVDAATTNTRTYWLAAGTGAGKRMKINQGTTLPGDAVSFASTVQLKERLLYFTRAANRDKENWFGRVVAASPLDQTITVSHVNPEGSARLEVSLQGVTAVPHVVAVALNGVPLGTMTYVNGAACSASLVVPAGLVREGANSVTLTRTGSAIDVSLVDAIRLTYSHAPVADRNEAVASIAPRRGAIRIGGFTSPSVRVVDVTDPANVSEFTANVSGASSNYSVTVPIISASARTLYAFAPDRALHPAAIAIDTPSSWNRPENGADLVVITYRVFAPALAPLVAQRQADGFRVAVVDVEDVYDEFTFGYHSPAAIRAFLARARSAWRTPPSYVLLVGDASLDPRDYRGIGRTDFVPTRMIETSFAETASDDWYSDVDGDQVPDLAIGRLPVSSVEETAAIVGKIVAYAQGPSQPRKALIVADLDDGLSFEDLAARVRATLPPDVAVEQVNREDLGDAAAHAQTVSAINDGKATVFYAGHGSVDLWRGSVLASEDASALTNDDHLSVMAVSTCLNGYFVEPLLPCLGEALVRSTSGGAVAVVASSGVTSPIAQQSMCEAFYRQLYGAERVTVGEALRRAKIGEPYGDARQTVVLLGDPTTRLK